jgi:hypothetical protein
VLVVPLPIYKSNVSVVNNGSPATAVGIPLAKPLLNLNVFAIYLVLSYFNYQVP